MTDAVMLALREIDAGLRGDRTAAYVSAAQTLAAEVRRVQARPGTRLMVADVFGAPEHDDAAGWLLRSWPTWYGQERHGASTIMRPARDWPTAQQIVAAWPDRVYLEKLARTFLASQSPTLAWCPERTLAQFATAAPGIDAWLRRP